MYSQDDFHICFPVSSEKLRVKKEMLSAEQIDHIKKFDIKIGFTKNLISNLYPKKNYIVHYRNLKYYLANRWKLTKVHRILECKQSPCMNLILSLILKKNGNN